MSKPTCAICGGSEEEHTPDRQHAFTTTPGELKTPAQVQKEKEGARSGMVMVAHPPPKDIAERLVILLLDKGLITSEEALYVSLGRRPGQ